VDTSLRGINLFVLVAGTGIQSADAISDEELLSQFRKIEKLPDDKKKLVKEFLDMFIFKADLQKQLAS
jgi:ribosomal protein S13